jgi:quercetin dioxygenase-like cupin family protein
MMPVGTPWMRMGRGGCSTWSPTRAIITAARTFTSEAVTAARGRALLDVGDFGVRRVERTSRIHTHSGVEGFYVVHGAQCLETEARADRMQKGQRLAVAGGVTMRLVAIGPVPRGALAVVVYDASQTPKTRMETGPPLVPCM